jgi:hypothetical protein
MSKYSIGNMCFKIIDLDDYFKADHMNSTLSQN